MVVPWNASWLSAASLFLRAARQRWGLFIFCREGVCLRSRPGVCTLQLAYYMLTTLYHCKCVVSRSFPCCLGRLFASGLPSGELLPEALRLLQQPTLLAGGCQHAVHRGAGRHAVRFHRSPQR